VSAIIRVALTRNKVQIEPGQRGELSLTIQNLSEIVDQYTLDVEGLDAAWLTLSPPRISLFPQDEGQVTIKLHPPETARAGTYDFSVKVASRENPIEWTRVQGTLEVAPVFLFDVSLSPQRKTTTEREATFDLHLTNPGNVDLTLGLSATDPEAACTYRFHPSPVTVDAGGSATVELTVTSTQPPQEQSRLYSFTVKVAPLDAPQRMRTVSGQLQCQARVVTLDIGLWPERRSAVGAGKFQVQLNNRGNTDLSLVLEGTDPAEACAYKFDAQNVTLTAGQSREVGLMVAPIGRPPTDQSRVYDFIVRAVPEDAKHRAVQAAGQLECLPVAISFDMEILPGRRTVKDEGQFTVRLANRCEADLSLELSAGDDAGPFRYQFERSRVRVGPGKAETVSLTVAPREQPPPGETKSHALSVKATPVDAPHLAKKATARLEVEGRKRGLGIVAWSVIGFGLGGAIWGVLYRAFILGPAAMGAVGGLALGIGLRRRPVAACLAGAFGFAAGGLLPHLGLAYGLAAGIIWGALGGGSLGLALGYRWRALVLAAAGALGMTFWFVLL